MEEKILEVKNLTVKFNLVNQTVTAVEDLSFDLYKNEILAIVGESGSGKSVTSCSILDLIGPPGEIDKNSAVIFMGNDITKYTEKEMTKIRGSRISMIFQEPSSSFNPLFRIKYQIGESLRLHKKMKKKEAYDKAADLISEVHIPEAAVRAEDYPFQMSGGMLQRAMIAQTMACSPDILIADEPTTALDVTTQAQILGLIKEKKSETGMSVIFITHDLALVEDFCDRILIMYAGRMMEYGNAKEIFSRPLHPYTEDLLKAIPRPGMFKGKDKLFTIPGKVPDQGEIIKGCKYALRCSFASEGCSAAEPKLTGTDDHAVRCIKRGRPQDG